MLQSLISKLSAVDAELIDSKVPMRFKNADDFRTASALIMHEQGMIPDEKLLDACQQEYNLPMELPFVSYVPWDIINLFEGYPVVIISYNVSDSKIVLGVMPEYLYIRDKIFSEMYRLEYKIVPIFFYVDLFTKQYGEPDFLAELTVKDKWDFITQESLENSASDITITNTSKGASVYYNIRKKKIMSSRKIKADDVKEIANMLASSANMTMADDSARPRYFAIDINQNYRGRVVVNKTYYGLLMTIRVLSNELHNKTLEELGVGKTSIEFIREVMLSPEKGLRVFIGETMSGKNTTILTALCELVHRGIYKVVSVEQPVEILVDGIEQINADTDEEFEENSASLIRQNPDIVYFTEITDRTAAVVMKAANTSKAVFSTVHANSISQVLYRLEDITGMPVDRIIMSLHSCVYQELVRDDRRDTVHPYTRCVYFSDDLKMELYGKSLKEIVGILQAEELSWKEEKS